MGLPMRLVAAAPDVVGAAKRHAFQESFDPGLLGAWEVKGAKHLHGGDGHEAEGADLKRPRRERSAVILGIGRQFSVPSLLDRVRDQNAFLPWASQFQTQCPFVPPGE